jgi:hypothetical protein
VTQAAAEEGRLPRWLWQPRQVPSREQQEPLRSAPALVPEELAQEEFALASLSVRAMTLEEFVREVGFQRSEPEVELDNRRSPSHSNQVS